MIIVCPECTTKFRVNPDRISDRGTKVRCARCKQIFLAEKSRAAETSTDPLSLPEQLVAEATVAPPVGGVDTAEPTASYAEPEDSSESDFDYNSFREQDNLSEEEPFTFSSDAAAESASELLTETEEESFDFGAASEESDSVETSDSALAAAVETDASDAEIASYFSPTDAEPQEPAARPVPATKPKSGGLSGIIRILLLLILGILIIGGVLLYMNGPEQLTQVFQQLIGQQTDHPTESGLIVLKDLQGTFIDNQEVGELFTIRGVAINKFKEPRASIQVKGVIFDPNGKPLLQKTIFCGNPISDQELQALPFNKIEELMGNQFGKTLSNMKVNVDQAIPFVIVFRDLPQNLSEFSADVTSSKPATP